MASHDDDTPGNGNGFDPAEFARGGTKKDAGATANKKDKAALPGEDDDYQAAGFSDSECVRLMVILGPEHFASGKPYVALQYVHIDIGDIGFLDDGQVFYFLFAGLEPKLVIVYGRALLKIFDLISLRRMPWIRVADRDFRPDDDGPIITRIEIHDWVRPKRKGKALAKALLAVEAEESEESEELEDA